jgi:hypothetical protein
MKVCTSCQAVYNGKKWTGSYELPEKIFAQLERTLCTACKRIRDKIVFGTVHLEGDVLAERTDEIMSMIRHEEEIEKSHN